VGKLCNNPPKSGWEKDGWLSVKLEDIQILVQTIQDSDLVELVWETDGSRLVLKKAAACAPSSAPTAPSPAGVATEQELAQEQETADEVEESRFTILAPMVGTFYRAPAPDAEPYVQVGSIVEIGQPLCIIEAMKLMNEIESEVRGRIIEILAENAQPVEYGQPLFVIEQV
jgi:acetyl-CoA carboxylase biotin carboxyl carrier protein